MADQLPINFAIQSEQSLVNYDWVELATGTGYIGFYCGELKDNNGVQEILNENVFEVWHVGYSSSGSGVYSTGRETRAEISVASDTLIISKTFELSPLNTNKIVKGDLICQIAYGAQPIVSDSNMQTYANITFYVDDTQIATGTSSTNTLPANGTGITDGMLAFKFELPRTKIKRGEKIKIKLEIQSTKVNNNVAFILMHDPKARDVAVLEAGGAALEKVSYNGGETTKFFIPFEIDL